MRQQYSKNAPFSFQWLETMCVTITSHVTREMTNMYRSIHVNSLVSGRSKIVALRYCVALAAGESSIVVMQCAGSANVSAVHICICLMRRLFSARCDPGAALPTHLRHDKQCEEGGAHTRHRQLDVHVQAQDGDEYKEDGWHKDVQDDWPR